MTTTSSNNFTGLYGGANNTIVPTTPYGNANVVGLLSTGTDGANTVGNVLASGNVTGVYFIGDGSLLTNVISTAALTGNMSGNIAGNGFSLNNIQTESILGNLTVSGNIRANVAGTRIYANSITTTQNIECGKIVGALTFSSIEDISVGRDLAVYGNISAQNASEFITLTTTSGAALDLPSTGNVTFTPGTVGNTAITTLGNLRIAGNITYPVNALANITTSQYFKGDGSLLTNLPAGNYTNANVSTFLAAFGSNTISTTGNVTAGYFLGDGSQLANLPAGNYTNANVSTFLAAFGSNTISTTGNVTAGYFLGNGSQLTGLPATYSDANVVTLLASFGSNTISTTGNITSGNIDTSGRVSAGGNVLGGNILSSTFQAVNSGGGTLKNASGTTQASWGAGGGDNFAVSVSTNLNGANAQIDISPTGSGHVHIKPTGTGAVEIAPTSTGSINNMVIGNVTPAAVSATTVSATTVSATGNVIVGNISTAGQISATGNITGGNLITGGALIAPSFSAAGNITGGNLNTAGTVSTSGAVIAGTTISAVGNITGGNIATGGILSATGNLTGGNLFVTGAIVNNTNAFSLASTPTPGRIIVGPGYGGDYTNTYDPLAVVRGTQLGVFGKYSVGNTDTNQSMRALTSLTYIDAGGGTLNNSNRRIAAGSFQLNLGNGTYTVPTNASLAMFAGSLTAATVGNLVGTGAGNATVSHAVGHFAGVNVQGGGTVGNLISFLSNPAGGNSTAAITTQMAYGINQTATTGQASPTNVFGLYNPNATATYGFVNSNINRAATNYYFLRNDDDVAQNKMGSLRSYTEYSHVNSTSGSITIDKNNGQVQQIELSGNVTGITLSNFVTTASDGTNTDNQADTVTVAFNQGATGGYGVTFPTASATIKYANGANTLPSTAANSVTLVSITAMYLNSATTYLITISPGFV